jgi:hypothetical protein
MKYGPFRRRNTPEDYPYTPAIMQRARRELREQAIQRTLEEIHAPHRTWGIDGHAHEFRANTGVPLTERALAQEARVRLSLLRAVNI